MYLSVQSMKLLFILYNIEIDNKVLGQNLHHIANECCLVTQRAYSTFLSNLLAI